MIMPLPNTSCAWAIVPCSPGHDEMLLEAERAAQPLDGRRRIVVAHRGHRRSPGSSLRFLPCSSSLPPRRLVGSFREAPARRRRRQLRARAEIELAIHVDQMRLHRRDAHEELRRDLPVRQPRSHQLDDAPLGGREAVPPDVGPPPRAAATARPGHGLVQSERRALRRGAPDRGAGGVRRSPRGGSAGARRSPCGSGSRRPHRASAPPASRRRRRRRAARASRARRRSRARSRARPPAPAPRARAPRPREPRRDGGRSRRAGACAAAS